MRTNIFSVYDSKALCYGVPFFMATVGAAVRAFQDVANDVNSVINRHPMDFVLYKIGEFDDEKGIVESLQPFISLGHGGDFVKPVSGVLKMTEGVK
ncbi:MAG: DNA binding protein [Microviridae sp. ctKAt32]|nr:MAG: DNA binding protein [Microviridae sp. ctKAt32]